MTCVTSRLILSGAFVCLAAAAAVAQTSSVTETKKFQLIAVDGRQLVVKFPEGTRELTVPPDFRFTVDGKSLSLNELKPGMAGTASITTTTTVTPVSVTEVKNGTVTKSFGTSIIVFTGGAYKLFTQSDIDKRGVKIMKNGKPAEITDLKENDRLTATIITPGPPRVMTQKEVSATLATNTPPPSKPVPAVAPSPSPAAAPVQTASATTGAPAPEPRKLPKTASSLPALGLVGLTAMFAGFGLTARRRLARP